MNLRGVLEDLLRRMKSAKAVYIMDKDGLVVDKVQVEGVRGLEEAFVEILQGYKSLNNSALELKVGAVNELSLLTGTWRYLIRPINRDYFLILAMLPTGYLGEGSWRLRNAAESMAEDFSS